MRSRQNISSWLRAFVFNRLALATLACLAAAPADNLESDSSSYPHPTILAPVRWPGALAIGIVGWFAMAAVLGVVIRYNAPPEELVEPSKTEPPGEEMLNAE